MLVFCCREREKFFRIAGASVRVRAYKRGLVASSRFKVILTTSYKGEAFSATLCYIYERSNWHCMNNKNNKNGHYH